MNDIFTFHHLIVSRENGGPYERWNGAILCGKTAHRYLHLIEAKDYDMYLYLKSELIEINEQGSINKNNLIRINNILKQFETEHSADTNNDRQYIIREEFTRREFINSNIIY